MVQETRPKDSKLQTLIEKKEKDKLDFIIDASIISYHTISSLHEVNLEQL